MVNLHYPENEVTVSLQTTAQKAFIANSAQYSHTSFVNWREMYPGTPGMCNLPVPVKFSWTGEDDTAEFQLSDTADFSRILYRACGCQAYEVTNLQAGKTYYWRVGDSEIRSFHTAYDLPRFISVGPKIDNVRDIGGYQTVYGRRVKQGMIYRGVEFNGHQDITPEEIRVLREDLGVICDFDLRLSNEGGYISKSPLGEGVKLFKLFTDSYGDFLDRHAHAAFLIRVFGDRDIYPLYIHCAGGTDRTGTVAMMLLSVLGVSDEDIYTDYEATSLNRDLCDISRHNRADNSCIAYFEAMKHRYYGKTLHESFCNFLHLSGITDEELDAFREIMLEPEE